MTAAIVVAIGNPYRGDDGVGHAAAAVLMDRLPETEVVLLDGEPTRLVDAWAGRRLAVVLDAVHAGDPPGTVHRIEIGADAFPAAIQSHSTHGGGLAAAVALGRALDRMPGRLVVYGVEPADVTEGHGLSPVVADAVPALVEAVIREARSTAA